MIHIVIIVICFIGTGGRILKVGKSELSKHNTREDAWLALRGKVYNITPYLNIKEMLNEK